MTKKEIENILKSIKRKMLKNESVELAKKYKEYRLLACLCSSKKKKGGGNYEKYDIFKKENI